jgi:hypothetical protein
MILVRVEYFEYVLYHDAGLKALNQVKVDFLSHSQAARVVLSRQTETVNFQGLTVGISCTVSEWQLSSLAQICSSWPRVPSPFWNASTSSLGTEIHDHIGRTILKARNGWNFYTVSPL